METVKVGDTASAITDSDNDSLITKVRHQSRSPDSGAFIFFSCLPPELKIHVWKQATPYVTLVEFRVTFEKRINRPTCSIDNEDAALLSVCHNSREIALANGVVKLRKIGQYVTTNTLKDDAETIAPWKSLAAAFMLSHVDSSKYRFTWAKNGQTFHLVDSSAFFSQSITQDDFPKRAGLEGCWVYPDLKMKEGKASRFDLLQASSWSVHERMRSYLGHSSNLYLRKPGSQDEIWNVPAVVVAGAEVWKEKLEAVATEKE